MDAALAIAATRGYSGTTVAQVTAATGLPASSVYWHFGSKDELVAEALEHSYRLWRRALPESIDEVPQARSARQLVLDRIGNLAEAIRTRPEFWRLGLMLAFERRPVEPLARARFLDVRHEFLARTSDWWARLLARDGLRVASEVLPRLARLTMAAMDGLFLARQARDDEDLDAVVRMVGHGLHATAVRPTGGTTARGDAVRGVPTPARASKATSKGSTSLSGREKVLDAAAQIAAECGYDGTTISRICSVAGLPPTSVYWFYKNKDELLAAALQRSFDDWRGEVAAWPDPGCGTPWPAALRPHLAATLRTLSDSPNFLRLGLMLVLERKQTPPASRELFVDIRTTANRTNTQWFAETFSREGEMFDQELPEHLSRLLMAFSDGLFISHQLDSPAWDAEVYADLVAGALENAVSRSEVPTTTAG